MRIYLGGHLNFYHPQKDKWLEIETDQPILLSDVLNGAGIPLNEVQLVAINGEVTELQNTVVSHQDEVKIFSAVGGG
jgi:sulfur carrier protein ThiS